MTRWSAITRTRAHRSALAYGSRSTTGAETTSTGSYTTSGDATANGWAFSSRYGGGRAARPTYHEREEESIHAGFHVTVRALRVSDVAALCRISHGRATLVRPRGVHKLGPTATKCEICRQDQGCGPHSLRSSDHRSGTEANRVFLDPYTVACRDTCSCVVDETKSRRRDSVIVFHRGCGLGLRRIEPQNHSLSFVRQVGLIRPSTGGSWCRFTSPGEGHARPSRARPRSLQRHGLWDPQPQPESRGGGGAAAAPFAAALRRAATSSRGWALCGAWPWCGAPDDGTPGIQSLPDPQVGLQLDLRVSVALRSRGRCGL